MQGIKLNEEKPKYVIVKGNRRPILVEPHIKIMEYKFQNLCSLVNDN
jgi:hypothetical protein